MEWNDYLSHSEMGLKEFKLRGRIEYEKATDPGIQGELLLKLGYLMLYALWCKQGFLATPQSTKYFRRTDQINESNW